MKHFLSRWRRWRLRRDHKALLNVVRDAFPDASMVKVDHHPTNAGWRVSLGLPYWMYIGISYEDTRRRNFSGTIQKLKDASRNLERTSR